MTYLRKENGQFNGSQMTAEFPLMAKFLVCLGIALLLALSFLIITKYLIDAKNLVMEAWANMDNAAYTNYVRGYATSTPETPAVIMEKIAKCESGGTHYKKDGTLIKNINRNGTIDVGKFQINSAWEAKARAMSHGHLSSRRKREVRLLALRHEGYGVLVQL